MPEQTLPSGIVLVTAAPAPPPVPESTYERRCESITATLRYQGREYTVVAECGGRITVELALFLWTEGNNSCDCQRAEYIREQCDPDFPELDCGDEIELVGDPGFELWDGEMPYECEELTSEAPDATP